VSSEAFPVVTQLTGENTRFFVGQNGYEPLVYIFLIKD
jgi:hypothetical protein